MKFPPIRPILIGSFAVTITYGPLTALAQNVTIQSLSGGILAAETSSFKTATAGLTPSGDNIGQDYVYGGSGDAMEAFYYMYDATRDRAILDRLITYCDKAVSIKNTSRVMWTGNRDPIWPNKATTATDAKYWGPEQGDVASHIGACCLSIALSGNLWNTKVTGQNVTYRQKAESYMAVANKALDLIILHFYNSSETRFVFPDTDSWPVASDRGERVPWNQQAMITGAMWRLARAHELFATDSTRVTKYRTIAKQSAQHFLDQCKQWQYTKNGKTVYKWSYSAGDFTSSLKYIEDIGHGGYDILGITRAYYFGKAGIASGDMTPFANTLLEVIHTPEGKFWGAVNGTGSLKSRIGNTWRLLAQQDKAVYTTLCTTGSQNYADAAITLWIKDRRNKGIFPK